MDVRNTVMFWCYVELLCGCKKYSDVCVEEGRHTVMFWCYVELLCYVGCEEGRHTVMFWCYLELLCGCKKYSDVGGKTVLVLC